MVPEDDQKLDDVLLCVMIKMIIIMIMMTIVMMMILDMFHFVTESRAESISSARATSLPSSEIFFDMLNL